VPKASTDSIVNDDNVPVDGDDDDDNSIVKMA